MNSNEPINRNDQVLNEYTREVEPTVVRNDQVLNEYTREV